MRKIAAFIFVTAILASAQSNLMCPSCAGTLQGRGLRVATSGQVKQVAKIVYFERGDNFSSLLTAIGSDSVTIVVDTLVSIAANTTIPANVSLNMGRAGRFAIATGVTLTINGPFSSDLHWVFFPTGTGQVVFGPGYVSEFYPQWWGAFPITAAATPANLTSKIQAACKAAAGVDYRRIVRFTGGYWDFVGLDLSIATGSGPVTLKGDNNSGSILRIFADTDHLIKVVNVSQAEGWVMEDLRLLGKPKGGVASVTFDAVYMELVVNSFFTRCYFAHARYGLNLESGTQLINMTDCIFGSGNQQGLRIRPNQQTFNKIVNCWFDENVVYGLYIRGHRNVITNSIFMDNTNTHIYFETTSESNLISNCQFWKGSDLPTKYAVRNYGLRNSIIAPRGDHHDSADFRVESGALGNALIDIQDSAHTIVNSGTDTYIRRIYGSKTKLNSVNAPSSVMDITGTLRVSDSTYGATGEWSGASVFTGLTTHNGGITLGTAQAFQGGATSSGHSFGSSTANAFLRINPTSFTGSSDGRIFNIAGTLNAVANNQAYISLLSGTIAEAGSGVHPLLVGTYFGVPSITGAAATVTDATTVYIAGPTAATVTGANYSIWVDAGNARFDALVHGAAGISTTAGGSTTGITLGTAPGILGIYFGSGAPSISAGQGSLYLRTDGSTAITRAYINTDGGTTWTSIATAL